MDSDKTSENNDSNGLTKENLKKTVDWMMANSVPKIETDEEYLKRIGEAVVDVSPKPKHARVSRSEDLPSIDHSDFGIHYRMIRPPSKRIEEA